MPARRNGVEMKTTVLDPIATSRAGATDGLKADSSLRGTCIQSIRNEALVRGARQVSDSENVLVTRGET